MNLRMKYGLVLFLGLQIIAPVGIIKPFIFLGLTFRFFQLKLQTVNMRKKALRASVLVILKQTYVQLFFANLNQGRSLGFGSTQFSIYLSQFLDAMFHGSSLETVVETCRRLLTQIKTRGCCDEVRGRRARTVLRKGKW